MSDADIEKLADQCCDACGGHKGSAKVLYREDIVKIYKNGKIIRCPGPKVLSPHEFTHKLVTFTLNIRILD